MRKETKENVLVASSKMQIFSSGNFGQLRILMIDEEPWFVGKDVAEALGYVKARNAIGKHVLSEDKKEAPIQGTLGGTQQMTIINESGLYALIFGSKLESAKQFKRWVTSEVLPTLRKTGAYSLSPIKQNIYEKFDIPTTLPQALRLAADLKEKNEKLLPKAEAYDELMASEGCLKFIEVAAVVDIGRNTLLEFLRQNGVITKTGRFNVPYRRFIDEGLFEVVTDGIHNSFMTVTMVTPKGLDYIYHLIKKCKAENDFNTPALIEKIKEMKTLNKANEIRELYQNV